VNDLGFIVRYHPACPWPGHPQRAVNPLTLRCADCWLIPPRHADYCPTLPLLRARATLCDLLIGQGLRARAAELLRRGLELEQLAGDSRAGDFHLDSAAHAEWMAQQAEWGRIAWGGRLNRCGYQPISDSEE